MVFYNYKKTTKRWKTLELCLINQLVNWFSWKRWKHITANKLDNLILHTRVNTSPLLCCQCPLQEDTSISLHWAPLSNLIKRDSDQRSTRYGGVSLSFREKHYTFLNVDTWFNANFSFFYYVPSFCRNSSIRWCDFVHMM